MKQIKHALSTFDSALTDSASAPLPMHWIEAIFDRFHLIFGDRFADNFSSCDIQGVKASWALALAGFTGEEIARGLRECQHRSYPPSLGEFSRYSRPALDPEVAWAEAEAGLMARGRGELGIWSHPAIYRAAIQFAYEIRTQPFKVVRKRWELLLQHELRKGLGDPVPMPPPRVTYSPEVGPPTPETRKKLQELRLSLGRSGSTHRCGRRTRTKGA